MPCTALLHEVHRPKVRRFALGRPCKKKALHRSAPLSALYRRIT